jgi:hypothetical protein
MATTFNISKDETKTKIKALLQSYFQSGNLNFLLGSGASVPALTVAGNIEAAIDAALKKGDEAMANLLALCFIQSLTQPHSLLQLGAVDGDLKEVLLQYTTFLRLIDRILFERKNVLLPRQANIFTSNYDMFVEHAAASIPTLILNDGFKRSGVLDDDFFFAPECYFDRTYRAASIYSQSAEIPTINLMKLHGSLSWERKSDKIAYRVELPAPLSDTDMTEQTKVTERLAEYFLVFPNLRKHHESLMERTYYDLLRLYANSLERENAVLICFGFSFQDEHILDITRRALRNPTAQLVIVAYDASAVSSYEEKFAANRNVCILAPQDGGNLTFESFNELMQTVLPLQEA